MDKSLEYIFSWPGPVDIPEGCAISIKGNGATFLGMDSTYAFSVSGNLTLSNLAIQFSAAGGIHVQRTGSLSLQNSLLNGTGDASAVYLNSSTATAVIHNCTFRNVVSALSGGS